jgi:hypothetical protein
MSEGQPRDDGGRFGEKLTDQAILKVFDHIDEPFLTTAEVHDHLDVEVSKKAVYQRLNRMHEDDVVGKKSTGARSVGWWATVAPQLAPDIAEELESEDTDRDEAVGQAEMKQRLGIDD